MTIMIWRDVEINEYELMVILHSSFAHTVDYMLVIEQFPVVHMKRLTDHEGSSSSDIQPQKI